LILRDPNFIENKEPNWLVLVNRISTPKRSCRSTSMQWTTHVSALASHEWPWLEVRTAENSIIVLKKWSVGIFHIYEISVSFYIWSNSEILLYMIVVNEFFSTWLVVNDSSWVMDEMSTIWCSFRWQWFRVYKDALLKCLYRICTNEPSSRIKLNRLQDVGPTCIHLDSFLIKLD
jgi:hypothetical protein